MKAAKRVISTLLLLVLTSLVGAEVVGNSTHIQNCASEAVAPEKKTVTLNGCQGHDQTEQNGKCSDPCHVGQSHFGHCSFFSTHANIHVRSMTLDSQMSPFLQVAIDGPFLEGPRRPPRLA